MQSLLITVCALGLLLVLLDSGQLVRFPWSQSSLILLVLCGFAGQGSLVLGSILWIASLSWLLRSRVPVLWSGVESVGGIYGRPINDPGSSVIR